MVTKNRTLILLFDRYGADTEKVGFLLRDIGRKRNKSVEYLHPLRDFARVFDGPTLLVPEMLPDMNQAMDQAYSEALEWIKRDEKNDVIIFTPGRDQLGFGRIRQLFDGRIVALSFEGDSQYSYPLWYREGYRKARVAAKVLGGLADNTLDFMTKAGSKLKSITLTLDNIVDRCAELICERCNIPKMVLPRDITDDEHRMDHLFNRLVSPSQSATDLANYLSRELGLQDESIDLILSAFGGQLNQGLFKERIGRVQKPSAHPVLIVRTKEGNTYVCKLHYNGTKAVNEQNGHYYLPQAGLDFIVPTHIIRPYSGSNVYLTLQYYIPEDMQIRQCPNYYLEAIARLHAYGKRIMKFAGVEPLRMQIPSFDEVFESIRYDPSTENFTSRSRIRALRQGYEEARHMLSEREDVLIHGDLYWKQVLGPYIGDLESLCVADDSFALATWLNDPDRPLSDEQKRVELRTYYRFYSRENPQAKTSFDDLYYRFMAATCIRRLMSFAWNTIHFEDASSIQKREFIGANL